MTPRMLDFSKFNLFSLEKRKPEISVEQFARPCVENSTISDYLRSLPTCGSGKELTDMVKRLADVKRAGRPLILGVGGDVLDEGLSPIVCDLLERSVVSAIALTGTAVFKDVEIASSGGLYADVPDSSDNVVCARETAEIINNGVNCGADEQMGLGEALGEYLNGKDYQHNDKSLLVTACRNSIPVTVHMTIGAETAHFLPSASGDNIGRTAHLDFRIFGGQIANLQGGVFMISGSAATLPGIFVKTLQAVRAMGYRVDDFAAGFLGGRGLQMETQSDWRSAIRGECISFFNIEGPYGLLYQLVFACLLDELSETC